jgi:hypothetical protein
MKKLFPAVNFLLISKELFCVYPMGINTARLRKYNFKQIPRSIVTYPPFLYRGLKLLLRKKRLSPPKHFSAIASLDYP